MDRGCKVQRKQEVENYAEETSQTWKARKM